ncbi:unnamed protein product, partial [Meganyctiphanes norvegica]
VVMLVYYINKHHTRRALPKPKVSNEEAGISMTIVDLTHMQNGRGPPKANGKIPNSSVNFIPDIVVGQSDIKEIISQQKRTIDCRCCGPGEDDLRNYSYEGGSSKAGSLSSLASG